FGTLQGRGYFQGTNTFPDGIGKTKSFTYQGVEFFLAPLLNTIAGKAATEVGGAIVMSKEAYADQKMSDNTMTEVNEVYVDMRYVGMTYDSLGVVVDPSRVITFELTLPQGRTISKDINAYLILRDD
ncbi:MAG: hypothetical protein ACRCXT_19615, partial [Paraclostridium sp.]